MKKAPLSETGYTLVELVITISVIAVIAAIAVPAFAPESDKELQQAAAEFAAAMRYARSESIRTGEPHGFRFLPNQERIRVFTADTSTNPWATVFDVYHPVSKQLYDYELPAGLWGSGDPVASTTNYYSACNTPNVVYFDNSGTPWCGDPDTVLLESYQLTVSAGALSATAVLDSITGRVTVK